MSTIPGTRGRPAPDMVAEQDLVDSRTGLRRDGRYQAYLGLRIGFVVLPLLMGIDKFFNGLTDWPKYLTGLIDNIAPGTAQQFMYFVGAVEILAAVLVALKPRYAAYVVAAWLAGIIVNLLTYSGWYDVAARDFGLMLGAIALGRLASVYDAPLRRRR